MISPTRASGPQPSPTPRMAMSRSVIMPTRRSSLPTGRTPASICAIICAARSIVSSGETTRTSLDMHWPIFITCLLCRPRPALMRRRSAIGAAELAFVGPASEAGLVLDVSLDGAVALGEIEVASHRVGPLRLTDSGISPQIAVEVGLRFALVGHDAALLSAFRAALFVGTVGLGDWAFRTLRAAAPLLCVACRGAALIGLALLAAAAGGLGRDLPVHRLPPSLRVYRCNRPRPGLFR